MSFPSEYSLKSSAQASSRRSKGSTRARFLAFLRSLFQFVSEKQTTSYHHSRSDDRGWFNRRAANASSSVSAPIKRRQTAPPVRSTSDYENLWDVRSQYMQQQTTRNYQATNMARPGTHHVQHPIPPLRPPPPLIEPTIQWSDQYYTPQIRRANTARVEMQSAASGLQDIRIVSLDSQPTRVIRTISKPRSKERFVIREDARPIFSESVEIDMADVTNQTPNHRAYFNPTHQPPPLTRHLETKVVSVANIAVDSHPPSITVMEVRPEYVNSTEMSTWWKNQHYGQVHQRQSEVLSEEEEAAKRSVIKEKILTEWERSWHHRGQASEDSISSATTQGEPMMVDDELKELPSPSLQPHFFSNTGSSASRETKDAYESSEIAQKKQPQLPDLSSIRRVCSFTMKGWIKTSNRLTETHDWHALSLASYLPNLSRNCSLAKDGNSVPMEPPSKMHDKLFASSSNLPVPHEPSEETDYEFPQTANLPLLVCPQTVPLKRRFSSDRGQSAFAPLPAGESSEQSTSNFSIESLSDLQSRLSSCDFHQGVHYFKINVMTTKSGDDETREQKFDGDPIAPPNSLYPSGPNCLGVTLKNDTIDLGAAGRINYRTGSFLGRFTDQLVDRAKKIETLNTSTKSRSGQTLNDYLTSGHLDGSLESSTHPTLTRGAPVKPLVPKVPIEISKTTELDPVLALLQSDVSQLDEFRSNFREKSVRNQMLLKAPTTNTPHRDDGNGQHRTGQRRTVTDETSLSTLPIKQEDVDDAQRNLNSQIHDLIDIEISSTAKKSTMREKTAEKSQKEKTQEEEKGSSSFLRVRQHQFRWSERHQRSSPYTTFRPSPAASGLIRQPSEVKEREIIPSVNGPASPLDDQIHLSRGSLGKVISMRVPHIQDGIPIWVFSAGQLQVLKRMTHMQISMIHERVCPSNRLVKWRIGRKKSNYCKTPPKSTLPSSSANTAEPSSVTESQGDLAQLTVSIVVNQQSQEGKASFTTKDTAKNSSEQEELHGGLKTPDSANSASTFWPELKDTEASNTDLATLNAYGASRSFSGPLFGRPLAFWQHRVGYPFPPCICNMLTYLEQTENAAHGIFRRAGGKLRVQALRERIEKDIYWNNFDDWQPYDVADLLKQFFRELPESLLTNRLSSILINICHHAPETCTIDFLRLAMINLPDENRIALQSLLHFLNTLSLRSSRTEMSAMNLAICLAPSLFHFSSLISATSTPVSPLLANLGSRRRKKLDPLVGLEPKDLAEQAAAQKCLCNLITYATDIFLVTNSIVLEMNLDSERTDAPRLSAILSPFNGEVRGWLNQQVDNLLLNCGSSISSSSTSSSSAPGTSGRSLGIAKSPLNKQNWSAISKEALKIYANESGQGEDLTGFELSVSKTAKNIKQQPTAGMMSPALQTWRCSLLLPVENPQLIADKYWNERVSWDENVMRAEVMDELEPNRIQIHRVLFNAMAPQPGRECRVLRGRQTLTKTKDPTDLSADTPVLGVAIVSTSVHYGVMVPEVPPELLPSAFFSKEHLLIEKVTAHSKTSCRVTILSEADFKGFSQEWYASQWGHYLLRRLLALRHSFAQQTMSLPTPLIAQSIRPPTPPPPPPHASLDKGREGEDTPPHVDPGV